jgi:hypothetical protein
MTGTLSMTADEDLGRGGTTRAIEHFPSLEPGGRLARRHPAAMSQYAGIGLTFIGPW